MNGKNFNPVEFGIRWLCGAAGVLLVLTLFGASAEWIRAAGFFLAGAGAAPLGLWLAHRRTDSLSVQTENEIARRVTDAFTKAVELLGHADIAVRQGGIYALGRIASENPGEHPKIMNIIAAYLRHHSRAYVSAEVVKALESPQETMQWIREAFGHGRGAPKFIETKEDVIQWIVSAVPMPIDLEAAVAVICGRNTAFDICPANGKLLLDLSGVFLFRVDLGGAPLEKFNMTGATIRHCGFSGAKLSHAKIMRVDFTQSSFENADMSDAIAEDAIFSGAFMRGAKFHRADMAGANFEEAALSDADFRGAMLAGAVFGGAHADGANFSNADLSDADLGGTQFLKAEQIESALGDSDTKLPKGLVRPEHWTKSAEK